MNQNENKTALASSALSRTSRVGSWTLAMMLILLAVLVVINLLVAALPGSLTKFDTTNNGRFTLSKTTENFVKNVKRDIDIIIVSQNASVEPTLENFMERYTALNGRIRFRTVDPVADPTFLEQYTEIVGTGRYIIVQSDLRYFIVDSLSLETVYIHDMQQSIDLYSYEQVIADEALVNAYMQYYNVDLKNVTYYFNGEQAITAAIEYVVAEDMPHLYLFSGNDGSTFSAGMEEILSTVMLDYEVLTLQVGDAVPDDASCVIINAPAYDLTDAAYTALSDYLAGGGHVMLITKPENADMPKLMSLVRTFGLAPITGGALHEGNANRYVGSNTVLKPAVNTQDSLLYQAYANGLEMIMPQAHGILTDATLPEGVTVTTLFAATDAYTVAADGTETDFGAAATGVYAEDADTGAKLAWFASAEAFSDTSASTYGMGSFYYFALYADLFNDGYASTLSAIEGLEMSTQALNVSLLGLEVVTVILVVIPVAVLIGGIVVWVRRRRR